MLDRIYECIYLKCAKFPPDVSFGCPQLTCFQPVGYELMMMIRTSFEEEGFYSLLGKCDRHQRERES